MRTNGWRDVAGKSSQNIQCIFVGMFCQCCTVPSGLVAAATDIVVGAGISGITVVGGGGDVTNSMTTGGYDEGTVVIVVLCHW